MPETTTKKFIWLREIDSIDGNIITFTDGKSETYNTKVQSYIITDEPINDSDVQLLVVDNVAKDILEIFELHDVRFFDVNMIMQKVKWSCDSYNDRAMSKVAWLLDEYEGNVDKQIRNVRVSHLKNFLNS